VNRFFAKLQVQKAIMSTLEQQKAQKVLLAMNQFLSHKLHKWIRFA